MTKPPNLEEGSDKPNLEVIMTELETAQTDVAWYYRRLEMAFNALYSRWDGQSIDGRKHKYGAEECFPWENASDGRLRTVDGWVGDHNLVIEFAFYQAKIQATAMGRPLKNARQSGQTTKFLNWQLYTQMRGDLEREVPFASNHMLTCGAVFFGIEWEQQRRLDYQEINLPDLADLVAGQSSSSPEIAAATAQSGQDVLLMLMDAIADPEQEDALTTLVQEMSPILSRPQARQIVTNLRDVHVAEIPVPDIFSAKPRLTSLRPYIDLFFPLLTDDVQRSRWFSQLEPVTETELQDRIETEKYDPDFVKEALQHKGDMGDLSWPNSSMYRRDFHGEGSHGFNIATESNYKDFVWLHHFRYKAIDYGTPCLYKTIFCPAALKDKGSKPLYAKHGPDEYEHGLYPYVEWRFEHKDRPILSSRGIPEIAYTWENEIKAQSDGLTDRTSLSHRPPMIVPYSRVHAIKNTPIPGSVMGVTRPNEVQWMPLPPGDATPVEVIRMVKERGDDFWGLFGKEVDPEKKLLSRGRLGKRTMNPLKLVSMQILALDQQYMDDKEVEMVVGRLEQPFHSSKKEIEGAHQITATIDMQMIDEDYRDKKLELIGKAMAFKQEGVLFKLAMEAIEPDAADILTQDLASPAAQELEKKDEKNAAIAALNGQEWPFDPHGNHKLRMDTLMAETFHSPNPHMPKRLAANPDTIPILQKRLQLFQNNIQQFQQNPQIGRLLGTQAFRPQQAPETAPTPQQ